MSTAISARTIFFLPRSGVFFTFRSLLFFVLVFPDRPVLLLLRREPLRASHDYSMVILQATRSWGDSKGSGMIDRTSLNQRFPTPYASPEELLDLVGGLWESVQKLYHEKWGRPPTTLERALIGDFAIWVLRRGYVSGSCPVTRPIA